MSMRKKQFSRNIAGLLLVMIAFGGMLHFFPRPAEPRIRCTGPAGIISGSGQRLEKILDSRGSREDRLALYRQFNHYANPVALFNLNMKPIVWNQAATAFEGEYDETMPVLQNGVQIGAVGVV
ncbi:MAG: hypothetical protein GXO69_11450, partial [Acidobacteria bacterium]|nr:hypothetical protein [Acidobacteriota bacterium]